jgi:hypothetical protein
LQLQDDVLGFPVTLRRPPDSRLHFVTVADYLSASKMQTVNEIADPIEWNRNCGWTVGAFLGATALLGALFPSVTAS